MSDDTFTSWIISGTVIFIILFFGKIAMNAIDYSEYKEIFTTKCEASGGIVYIPKGVKGWPDIKCVNPDMFIDL